MRMIPWITRATLLLLCCAVGQADDRWVIRFQTLGSPAGVPDEPCLALFWADRLVLRNTASEAATVRLIGVSNGEKAAVARDITIPAGKSVVDTPGITTWYPVPGIGGPIWINHLDVPSGVIVASRGEVLAGVGPPCGIGNDPRIFGSLAFPVFDRLVQPGVAQYHPAVDLGKDGFGSADARINVGIYNAGTGPATATIEIRRECDDFAIDRRVVTVPANTLLQFGGFVTKGSTVGSPCGEELYRDYAVVIVDQPSLSYAVTASNQLPARIPVSVSFSQ